MLIYPTAGRALDEVFSVQGHEIRVVTLDLTEDWPAIEERLLTLLTWPGEAPSPIRYAVTATAR